MDPVGSPKAQRTVVKTYGRGGLLGLISVPFALVMAARGMNGWQQAAVREMEDDAVEMARSGHRVVSSETYGIPVLNVAWHEVTCRLADAAS